MRSYLSTIGYCLTLLLAMAPVKAEADENVDGDIFCINEIQVANIDQFIDDSYNYGGWVELFNKTGDKISLTGYYVSDNAEGIDKYRIPSAYPTMQPHGYSILGFDHNYNDGKYGNKAKSQVRFKLKPEGGMIYIFNTKNEIVCSASYPPAVSRCSWSRTSDAGSEWRYCYEPTRGAANTSTAFADEQLPAPKVNCNGRMFQTSFMVKVTIPEGCTLRYTTDGTTPTLTNGLTSKNGTFTVTATTVYRFRLFKDGYLPSPVTTRSFIKNDKNYTMPVVSVVTNPDNLYDDMIGVYVRGTNGISGNGVTYAANWNMDWERPVNFEYMLPDGTCPINQEADFYISGGWSRAWSPSSFKLKAAKVYEGVKSIDYPFFPLKPHNKHKVIVLRNGGNDTECRIKDAAIQRILLTSGFYIEALDWQPAHVFFNGSYIGMLNVREPSNKHYAYSNYGYDTDEVDAFELAPNVTIKAGTRTAYTNWLNTAKNYTAANAEDELRRQVDMDEYINYMAAETFIGPSDWLTNNNNTKGFRSVNDGKWHLVMLDTDSGFGVSNILTQIKNNPSNDLSIIFNNMMKIGNLKNQFITAYSIVAGSIFNPTRVERIVNDMGNITTQPLSIEGKSPWNSINSVLNRVNSTSERDARYNDLCSYFGMKEGAETTISTNISDAKITLNGQPVPTGQFNGKLFIDTKIEASAPAGYNFLGWKKVNKTNNILLKSQAKWEYYDKGSLDGKEWQAEDFTTDNWNTGYAPLGYGGFTVKTTVSYGQSSSNKNITTYLRAEFDVEDILPGDAFKLDYNADDGFVAYVNGVEAGRYNMPQGKPSYSTTTVSYVADQPASGTITIPTELFHTGTNVIAIELHQTSGTSSDLYWNAKLTQISSKEYGDFLSTERTYTYKPSLSNNLMAYFEPLDDQYLIAAESTPIVINEVSAANNIYVNEYFKKNDWIELYNNTANDIDIAGMYLSDDPDNTHKFQIPEGNDMYSTIVPAHGYLVVWADKLDPLSMLHTSFKLSNDADQCVIITAADDEWNSRLDYTTHDGEHSVGRYPDGGKRIYRMNRPTIDAANTLTSYAEWLYGEDVNFDTDIYDAITATEDDAYNGKIEFFTTDGMKINGMQKGVNIVRIRRNDGSTTVRKVIRN